MNALATRAITFARSGIALPIGLLAMLSMIVLPLPAIMLDALFTF